MIRLKATGGQTAFVYGTPSQQYNVDRDGTVEVPDESERAAHSMGFRRLTDGEAAAPRRKSTAPAA